MATATTDQKMKGIMEFVTGPAGKDVLKRSDDATIPLRNVIRAFRVTLDDDSTVVVADLYCPSVTLTAPASQVESLGYANLGIGSTARCANGFAYKVGAPGTDTWQSIISVNS